MDWLLGKNMGTAALDGKKWRPRFAIGVGGGESSLNTSDGSGELIEIFIVDEVWR